SPSPAPRSSPAPPRPRSLFSPTLAPRGAPPLHARPKHKGGRGGGPCDREVRERLGGHPPLALRGSFSGTSVRRRRIHHSGPCAARSGASVSPGSCSSEHGRSSCRDVRHTIVTPLITRPKSPGCCKWCGLA